MWFRTCRQSSSLVFAVRVRFSLVTPQERPAIAPLYHFNKSIIQLIVSLFRKKAIKMPNSRGSFGGGVYDDKDRNICRAGFPTCAKTPPGSGHAFRNQLDRHQHNHHVAAREHTITPAQRAPLRRDRERGDVSHNQLLALAAASS